MDFEHARRNMVEQQIRPWEVVDANVRQLLMSARREDYVPLPVRALAFADIEVPLPRGQFMLRPVIEGRILQAIKIGRADSVLEIGTGSGYFAALLASGANKVRTVEIEPELARLARDRLALSGVKNVVVEEGDGLREQETPTRYDVIVVSGGLPELPGNLAAQLATGGRLFAFVGEAPVMKARLVVREDEDHFHSRDLFETVAPMLRHAMAASEFHF
ncbi:MAG: protein-L-isoaspartate O-methyltransferase [Azoarcus sp.]|jgi:protein-L-isoaspartate(D-aspartate) O-methyltransferase|nr:protein-L-isoaspartate O-methyltransferase [Azoarcus sp.]